MDIQTFNNADADSASHQLQQCCAAARWGDILLTGRPYKSFNELLDHGRVAWNTMQEEDWLEAFDGHPKIGDPESLKKKYRATLAAASHEQSAVSDADQQILDQLAELNQAYLQRFGFIFIIFASGKSAEQMLQSLTKRVNNSRTEELVAAAAEQWKITDLRLHKLFEQSFTE